MTPISDNSLEPIGILALVGLLIFILALFVLKRDAKNRQDMFSGSKSQTHLTPKSKKESHNRRSSSSQNVLSFEQTSDGDGDGD